jgi:hypothetical protein
MCKIKREIIAVRRNLRWLLDHANSAEAFGDCFDILSRSYEILRSVELECLSQQNNPHNSCLLNEGR